MSEVVLKRGTGGSIQWLYAEPRTHQIHMYESGNKYLIEQLKFRDFLRNNEEARIQYRELKQHLLASIKTTNIRIQQIKLSSLDPSWKILKNNSKYQHQTL